MSWKTTRMTLSVGSYRSAKKNGFTKWAKVICHVSPVIDESTGEVDDSFSEVVEFWPDDQSVDKLLLFTKNAEEISMEGKEWKRWLFVGDNVPGSWKTCFSYMGELQWDYIEFEQPCAKIVKTGTKVKYELRDDGKPFTSVKYSYWVGPKVSPGLTLSKKSREQEVRRHYISLSEILSTDNNGADDTNDNNDEGAA